MKTLKKPLNLFNKYSTVQLILLNTPRPGTVGATMKNHVDESVKDARLQHLQVLLLSNKMRFCVLKLVKKRMFSSKNQDVTQGKW